MNAARGRAPSRGRTGGCTVTVVAATSWNCSPGSAASSAMRTGPVAHAAGPRASRSRSARRARSPGTPRRRRGARPRAARALQARRRRRAARARSGRSRRAPSRRRSPCPRRRSIPLRARRCPRGSCRGWGRSPRRCYPRAELTRPRHAVRVAAVNCGPVGYGRKARNHRRSPHDPSIAHVVSLPPDDCGAAASSRSERGEGPSLPARARAADGAGQGLPDRFAHLRRSYD